MRVKQHGSGGLVIDPLWRDIFCCSNLRALYYEIKLKFRVFFVKKTHRAAHPTPPRSQPLTCESHHMGRAYVRIWKETPYLHGRTSCSIGFVYFVSFDIKVTVTES